jgi:hypothetical protein
MKLLKLISSNSEINVILVSIFLPLIVFLPVILFDTISIILKVIH